MGTTAKERSRLGATGLLMAALLGGVSGCTADGAGPSAGAAPSPKSHRAEHAEHTDGETVGRAPTPLDGKAVVQAASRTGNATLPLKPIGTGKLAVQVNCQGKGTLTVAISPIGLSFPLTCGNEVNSIYDQIHLKRARAEAATIQITAPSTVRWALTAEQ
ncbi:hypothetical protein ABZ532_10455 [Streptomyces sp. NPDC019396]|uniref:hypothetical protein n=1 Tax=Streptomyces sp. NPDC019396 TaxID=3154687 RepID=UPI0033F84AEB